MLKHAGQVALRLTSPVKRSVRSALLLRLNRRPEYIVGRQLRRHRRERVGGHYGFHGPVIQPGVAAAVNHLNVGGQLAVAELNFQPYAAL